MSKFFRVMVYEYTRHVLRWRFLLGLLSIPFFIVVVLGISILSTGFQTNNDPIGYVDLPGVLVDPVFPPVESGLFTSSVDILPFANEDLAHQALDDGQVQGYYVLASDYLTTAQVRLVTYDPPEETVQNRFSEFLRLNLLKNQPAQVVTRVTEGTHFSIQSADGSRSMEENEWFNLLVPFAVGLIFIMVVFTSGGYLMQAVVEEKENRTMEIIITSVSPGQLMAGKIIGNLGVGLTQLVLWVLFGGVIFLVGRDSVDWLDQISVSGDFVLLVAVILLPTFVMIGSLMAAVGATVTEAREAQQISGLFTLPIAVPYWLTYQIMTNPDGPVAVGLSFFPLTAPVTLTMRAGFTQIPTAQLVLNVGVLVACAVGALWMAARAFRLGMLSYGKKITLREILGGPKASLKPREAVR